MLFLLLAFKGMLYVFSVPLSYAVCSRHTFMVCCVFSVHLSYAVSLFRACKVCFISSPRL